MLLPFRHSSIRVRLLLASTVVQVVLLSLLLANSMRLMNNAVSASLDTTITQNASMLHAMATAYGEQQRLDALQDVLGELLAEAEEGLVYVRIAGSGDQVLVSAGLPFMTHLPEPSEHRKSFLAGVVSAGEVVHVRRPLLLAKNEVGLLQFGVSVSVLAAARRAIMEQGLAIAIAEIALTFFLLSTIGYFLTRNLRRLLEGSKAIADGRLDHRVSAQGEDELAVIARHFNIMAATLQQRVDELQHTAERLQASEERHAMALHGANDGLWDWDLRAGTVYYSDRFCQILGVPPGSMPSAPEAFLGYIHPHEVASYRTRLISHLKGDSSQFMMEFRVCLPDGEPRWVLMRGVASRDEDLHAFRMAGSLGDINLRKRAEQQLMHDALHDGLTGLPNRDLLYDRILSAQNDAQRNGTLHCGYFLDLDGFKGVNDGFGHKAGDEALREVARRLKATVRASDTVARIGGDEFFVLAENIGNEAAAHALAHKLLDAIAAPFAVLPEHAQMGASIGLVLFPYEGMSVADLIHRADEAMYRVKTSGKGNFSVAAVTPAAAY